MKQQLRLPLFSNLLRMAATTTSSQSGYRLDDSKTNHLSAVGNDGALAFEAKIHQPLPSFQSLTVVAAEPDRMG
jgi:hypothetical protein